MRIYLEKKAVKSPQCREAPHLNLRWPPAALGTPPSNPRFVTIFFFSKLKTNIQMNTRQFFNIDIYMHFRSQRQERESNCYT